MGRVLRLCVLPPTQWKLFDLHVTWDQSSGWFSGPQIIKKFILPLWSIQYDLRLDRSLIFMIENSEWDSSFEFLFLNSGVFTSLAYVLTALCILLVAIQHHLCNLTTWTEGRCPPFIHQHSQLCKMWTLSCWLLARLGCGPRPATQVSLSTQTYFSTPLCQFCYFYILLLEKYQSWHEVDISDFSPCSLPSIS